MSKSESLNKIIQNISGFDNEIVVKSICGVIDDAGYCHGVVCDECPFNSTKDFDELAVELDED